MERISDEPSFETINSEANERLLTPAEIGDAVIQAANIELADGKRLPATILLTHEAIKRANDPVFLEKTTKWIDTAYADDNADYREFVHDVTDESIRLSTEEAMPTAKAVIAAPFTLERTKALKKAEAQSDKPFDPFEVSPVEEIRAKLEQAVENIEEIDDSRDLVEIAEQLVDSIEDCDDCEKIVSPRDVLIVEKAAEDVSEAHAAAALEARQLKELAKELHDLLPPQKMKIYEEAVKEAEEHHTDPLSVLQLLEAAA